MKLILRNKVFTINKLEAKKARESVNELILRIRHTSLEKKRPEFFYIFIFTMYIISKEYINAMDVDAVAALLEAKSEEYTVEDRKKYEEILKINK